MLLQGDHIYYKKKKTKKEQTDWCKATMSQSNNLIIESIAHNKVKNHHISSVAGINIDLYI